MPKVKKARARTSRPIPEVIDNQPWKIETNHAKQGSVDPKAHVMNVPLGVNPIDRIIKNHEMLHVKFSPKRPTCPPGTDPIAYQAAEDCRINYRGGLLGVDTGSVTVYDDRDIEALKKNITGSPNPELVAASLLLATTGSHDHMRVITEVLPDVFDDEEVSTIRYVAGSASYMARQGQRPSHARAKQAAKYLTEAFKLPPEADKKDNTSGKAEGENAPGEVRKALSQTIEYANFDALEKAEAKMGGPEEDKTGLEFANGSTPSGMSAVGNNWWGRMKIVEPPRTERFPSKMRSRLWKPSDQGTVLRYPQRYCGGDGTIFAAKGQKLGGCTVLIDASGSMQFTKEDVLRIMQLMPAALIATYCGMSREGTLTIVAKKGRRVHESRFKGQGGGNCVDGPALDWLAKQPGPRYWVSDGEIVGYEYARTPAMFAAVYKHCRDHHILRVDGLKDVIERFGGK